MSSKIFIFIIISLTLVIPYGYAQEFTFGDKANQKLVLVEVNGGDLHVKHIVSSSHLPQQLDLIDGTVENLIITDEDGEEQLPSIIGENDGVLILPTDKDSIIEYDLKDIILLKDNIWTLDFRYLETTNFILPEKLNMVFVNERPVYLEEKKGFTCHGCQMILEYMLDQPTNIVNVNWEEKEFFVEFKTFAEIENFEFNQPTKEITFDMNNNNQFVTTVIPLELLWGPYAIFLNDEKVVFYDYFNNGTHVWIDMKPDTIGKISIIGTTVVPEFPIIAPLAIGFLIIMMVPLMKRINLH
ncbi:hypothetical protein [Nitrosopumilus sp.]|uniref:hypothetical protein n=1 Tax=Nitrosopumilus sp. TaxID=2024843 RepID=UPI00247B68B5|nr:hypothetical protein [Nitrosopumilus sp.]MCV0430833.1 hypothetical protein [Nitrosopumilus sp.]